METVPFFRLFTSEGDIEYTGFAIGMGGGGGTGQVTCLFSLWRIFILKVSRGGLGSKKSRYMNYSGQRNLDI